MPITIYISHFNNNPDVSNLSTLIDDNPTSDKKEVLIKVDCKIDFNILSSLLSALHERCLHLDFSDYIEAFSRRNIVSIMALIQTYPNVIRLNLSKTKINDKGIKVLCKALKMNSSLLFLNLSETAIRNRRLIFIAHAIAENKGLKTLSLANNPMTSINCEILLDNLAENTTLVSLDIGGLIAKPEGAEEPFYFELQASFCNLLNNHPSLLTINMQDNHFSDDQSMLLQTIEAIDNRFVAPFLLSNFKHNSALTQAFVKHRRRMYTRHTIIVDTLDPILPKPIQGIVWNYLNKSPYGLKHAFNMAQLTPEKPKYTP